MELSETMLEEVTEPTLLIEVLAPPDFDPDVLLAPPFRDFRFDGVEREGYRVLVATCLGEELPDATDMPESFLALPAKATLLVPHSGYGTIVVKSSEDDVYRDDVYAEAVGVMRGYLAHPDIGLWLGQLPTDYHSEGHSIS